MCGLNGIFAYRDSAPAIDAREVAATRDHMRTRGPDGSGLWWSETRRCAFGHRRLSILDLSEGGAQPMASTDGQIVIAFNGEIYNFRELRSGLEREGVQFRTGSDTEVLLALYARDGERMLGALRGMFAFAIWDARRGGLLLARDPYGIKPLYVADDGVTLRFASQVKALLAGGAVSREEDPGGVVGFNLFGSVPEPFTLYRAIRSLPAGCGQWVGPDGAKDPVQYASIAKALHDGAREPASVEEVDARVRSAVLDSVRAHLVSDVEVGCFLSAGVDSGALLGLMRDAGQGVSQAITLGFEEFRGSPEDEAPLAAQVAAHYGARHVIRMVGEGEFRADLPAILDSMDQPSIDGINTWFVAKAASEAGLKVAISGLGGDELLAGYPSFRDIPRWVGRMRAPGAIPGLGRMTRVLLRSLAPGVVSRRPKAAGMVEYGASYPGAYLLRRGLHLPFELDSLMEPGAVKEGMQRLQPLLGLRASLEPDPGSPVGRVSALESQNYMKNQLLRDADWAGMAHSLEIRTPLVDFTLLKALAPVTPHLAPGMGKRALAAAPALPLPKVVTDRAKTGFGVPTNTWLAGVSQRRASAATKGGVSRAWGAEVLDRALPHTQPASV